LGFEGVPHRETVLVLPTVNCLVELTQMPFTVVALGDIEIINLERVGFNLKNFDMAIVFKVGDDEAGAGLKGAAPLAVLHVALVGRGGFAGPWWLGHACARRDSTCSPQAETLSQDFSREMLRINSIPRMHCHP
jgi:hypothetical protein